MKKKNIKKLRLNAETLKLIRGGLPPEGDSTACGTSRCDTWTEPTAGGCPSLGCDPGSIVCSVVLCPPTAPLTRLACA